MKDNYVMKTIRNVVASAGIALAGACSSVPHEGPVSEPTPLYGAAEPGVALEAQKPDKGGLAQAVDDYVSVMPRVALSGGFNSVQVEMDDKGVGQLRLFHHYDATVADAVTVGWKGLHVLTDTPGSSLSGGYFGIDQLMLSSPDINGGDTRAQAKLVTTADGLADWKVGLYDTGAIGALNDLLGTGMYGNTEVLTSDTAAEFHSFLGIGLGDVFGKPVSLELLTNIQQPFDGKAMQKYAELQANFLENLHARIELPDFDPDLARFWIGLHKNW